MQKEIANKLAVSSNTLISSNEETNKEVELQDIIKSASFVPEDFTAGVFLNEKIESIVKTMTVTNQMIFVLMRQGYKRNEIAKILDIEYKKTDNAMTNIRKKLKDKLGLH